MAASNERNAVMPAFAGIHDLTGSPRRSTIQDVDTRLPPGMTASSLIGL